MFVDLTEFFYLVWQKSQFVVDCKILIFVFFYSIKWNLKWLKICWKDNFAVKYPFLEDTIISWEICLLSQDFFWNGVHSPWKLTQLTFFFWKCKSDFWETMSYLRHKHSELWQICKIGHIHMLSNSTNTYYEYRANKALNYVYIF